MESPGPSDARTGAAWMAAWASGASRGLLFTDRAVAAGGAGGSGRGRPGPMHSTFCRIRFYGLEIESPRMDPWLQRLRHDLVKRASWPARDLAALLSDGAAPTARDVRALRAGLLDLRGPAGEPVEAQALVADLAAAAPARFRGRILDELRERVGLATRLLLAATDDGALARDEQRLREIMDSILSIAEAFDRLATSTKGQR